MQCCRLVCGGPALVPHRPTGTALLGGKRPAVVCLAGKGPGKGSNGSSKGGSGKGGARGSGSGRGGGRGGGSGGKQQKQKQKKPQQQESAERPCLVPPLRTTLLSHLTTTDRMPAPLWGTFCGVSNGLWCGITAAYSPFTGQPEPLALDDDGKLLLLLQQCCVEQRVVGDDGTDVVVRHVARSSSLEGLQREMMQGGQLQFPACSTTPGGSSGVPECWDEERFSSGQEGLVVFDGGSYSLGPAAVGSPSELPEVQPTDFDDVAALAATAAAEAAAQAAAAEAAAAKGQQEGEGSSDEYEDDVLEEGEPQLDSDEEEDGEEGSSSNGGVELAAADSADVQDEPELDWTAVMIEHCMQWGGEQRLRIRLTLDTAGGSDGTELEVQPLRVSVSREAWEGLPGAFTPSEQGAGAAELQEQSRRVRLDDGQLSGSWKVFEVTAVTVDDVSMETGLPTQSTLYSAGESGRSFDASMPEDGGEGALLLLPHSCGVQLETLRLDNQRRRGLRVATHWSPQPDMLLTMARLYDCDGKLLEVTTSTAIRDTDGSSSGSDGSSFLDE